MQNMKDFSENAIGKELDNRLSAAQKYIESLPFRIPMIFNTQLKGYYNIAINSRYLLYQYRREYDHGYKSIHELDNNLKLELLEKFPKLIKEMEDFYNKKKTETIDKLGKFDKFAVESGFAREVVIQEPGNITVIEPRSSGLLYIFLGFITTVSIGILAVILYFMSHR